MQRYTVIVSYLPDFDLVCNIESEGDEDRNLCLWRIVPGQPFRSIPFMSIVSGSRWQLTKCVSVICRPQGLSKGSLSWGSGPLHSHPLSQFWWTYPCLRHFPDNKTPTMKYLFFYIKHYTVSSSYVRVQTVFPKTKTLISENLYVYTKKKKKKKERKINPII